MSNAEAPYQQLTDEAITLLAESRQTLAALSEKITALVSAQNGNNRAEELTRQANILLAEHRQLSAMLTQNSAMTQSTMPVSAVQLLQWQEEERAKIAKQLEDTDGQLLANAVFELSAVKNLLLMDANLDEVMAGIDALQQELENGLASLRFLVADLEPGTVLGNFGLVAGLRRYLEKFQNHTHISTDLQVHTLVEPLPYIIETAIFRVIQEALHNITQHANASAVQVIVAEVGSNLQFIIRDDGVGISANLSNHPRRQLGLVSITEIANLLHGSIEINSEEASGTEVILSIPYPKF